MLSIFISTIICIPYDNVQSKIIQLWMSPGTYTQGSFTFSASDCCLMAPLFNYLYTKVKHDARNGLEPQVVQYPPMGTN